MSTIKSWAPWTDADRHKLIALVERGDSWESISDEMGHSIGACSQQYRMAVPASRRQPVAKLRRKIFVRPASERATTPEPQPAALQAPPGAPSRRRVSHVALLIDAELRGRIEVLGVTGGLLGDPLPGRSVLDQTRMGIIASPGPPNHREAYFASQAKITLATEPMR